MITKYWQSLNQSASTRQHRWTVGSFFFVLTFSCIFLAQSSWDLFYWRKVPRVIPLITVTLPPITVTLPPTTVTLPTTTVALPTTTTVTLTPTAVDLDQPPAYKRLKKWEIDLPQHNLDLPFPEGRTGRFVFFKNQNEGLGWNNELNEV